MTDRIIEARNFGTTDISSSLRECAYGAMYKGGDLISSTSHAQKSVDELFGNLSITDEHARADAKKSCAHSDTDSVRRESSKPGANQVALDVVPGSSTYGIGFSSLGSMVMGPMQDGKILGGGRVVVSPSGGATFSPTLRLTGPKV